MKTKTRVSVTMTQHYIEKLDRVVKAGLYLNRGQAIMVALRHVYGVEDSEDNPRLRAPPLETVKDFVLSRRSDIELGMENLGMLTPVLNYFLEEAEE